MPRERRREDDRHPLRSRRALVQLRSNSTAVFVSFSTRSHLLATMIRRAARLPRLLRDLQILHVHRLGRVHQQQAHVGALDRAFRAQRAVVLEAAVDARLPPQPRRVDEDQSRPW
jgi:hypothetical protein